MSKLEDLIAKLCPNGVEYKKIGDIASISTGSKLRDIQESHSLYEYINAGTTNSGYSLDWNCDGDVVTTPSRGQGGIGYVGYQKNKFWLGPLCYKIVGNADFVLNKYLYYCLSNNSYEILSLKKDGGVPAINKSDLEELILPIPPLEVQAEIVRILDTFTELTTKLTENLTAELTARSKQYEYYRDTLLTFDDNNPLHSLISRYCPTGVEYKKIGDIATDVFRGSGIKKDQVTSTGIPCVRYGEIYTKYNLWFDSCFSHTSESLITNKKYFEHGDILFAITGESVEDIAKSCAYVGNEKCLAGGDIVVVKHNQNPKYLSYALSTTNARLQKSSGKVKSKVVHASTESIKGITIPVPPLDVQRQIVQILDRFDALCNDLTQGLPAEIEARRKQYEYYRDQLLNFKRA